MSVMYPRLVGGLGLLWALILREGLLDWPNRAVWASYALSWIVTCGLLTAGRHIRWAGAALCALSLAAIIEPARHLTDGLALFAWIGIILAVTDGRPEERALLVRVLVTTVYAFAALTKLNPTFIDGDQLVGIFESRERWDTFVPAIRGGLGIALSWVGMLAEASLAVGMWWPRTRRLTALLGLVVHPVFIVVATYGTVPDMAFITVLNLLLVVSYLAFWEPIAPPVDEQATAGVAA